MQIHPILYNTKPAVKPTFCGKQTNFLELLHRNYSLDVKTIVEKITKNYQPASTSGSNAVYNIYPNKPKTIPAANTVKGLMEIVVNRSKKLVESIKIFAGNKEEKLLESSEYTYNKKGQIIRILRSTTSPNDNLHQIKTNIKYEDNGITIQKDFDNGTKYLKTIITTLNNKKHILKFSKNNTGTIEKFKYTEKEALCSSREKEGTGVLFEASGDPLTGEMVFSKNITSPCNRGEYIELLSNGNYYKQVVAKDWHISTKEIPASIADDFIHQKVDLMTPENEMLTKLEEYGL